MSQPHQQAIGQMNQIAGIHPAAHDTARVAFTGLPSFLPTVRPFIQHFSHFHNILQVHRGSESELVSLTL